MKRKVFLQASCSLCVGLALAEFPSCAPLPIYESSVSDRAISIPINALSDGDVLVVRARGLEYDIALRKQSDGSCLAFLLRCTHADNALALTGRGFKCSLHGSTFDEMGSVTKGPASVPLRRLKVERIAENLIVRLD
jgi:Rieske Fe-S protein